MSLLLTVELVPVVILIKDQITAKRNNVLSAVVAGTGQHVLCLVLLYNMMQ